MAPAPASDPAPLPSARIAELAQQVEALKVEGLAALRALAIKVERIQATIDNVESLLKQNGVSR